MSQFWITVIRVSKSDTIKRLRSDNDADDKAAGKQPYKSHAAKHRSVEGLSLLYSKRRMPPIKTWYQRLLWHSGQVC